MGGESPYAPARTDHQHPIALLHTSAIHLLGGRETRTRDRRGDPRRKVVRDNGAHVGVHRGPSSQTSLTGQIMVDGHARADHDLRGVAYRLDPSHDIQAQDVRPRPPVGTRLSQFPVHRVQPTGLDGQPHLTRTRGRDVDGRRTHLPWRPGRHQGDALGGQDVVIGLIHSGEIAHASAPEPGVHLGIVGFPSVLQVNVDLAAQPVVARSAAFRPIRGPETASPKQLATQVVDLPPATSLPSTSGGLHLADASLRARHRVPKARHYWRDRANRRPGVHPNDASRCFTRGLGMTMTVPADMDSIGE